LVCDTLWPKLGDRSTVRRFTDVSTILSDLPNADEIGRIAWPVDVDQPANAAHLTLNLDVAFELIEARSGENGLKPLYRGTQAKGTPEALVAEVKDVLQRARGEEGARKRRNAEVIKNKLRMTWEEGGEGLEDLRRLLHLASKDR
jgi:hypothetical protein